METSRLATGQPTLSQSENGCDLSSSRLPHNEHGGWLLNFAEQAELLWRKDGGNGSMP